MAFFGALLTLASLGHTASASAQGGECFPSCRAGFVCSPNNECVSICNPGCSASQICTAEATCIDNPVQAQTTTAPQRPAAALVQETPQFRPNQPAAPVRQTYVSSRSPTPVSSDAQSPAAAPVVTSAPDITRSGRFRLVLSADLGFAGSAKVLNGRGHTLAEGDTDVSIGGGVIGLFPIGRVFLLGAELATHTTSLGNDGFTAIRLGPSVGFHYAVDAGTVAVDPFVLVTAGLSVLSSEGADSTEGFGVATRVGLNVWASQVAGVRFALGYRHSAYSVGNGSITFGEMFMEVGLSLRFGG